MTLNSISQGKEKLENLFYLLLYLRRDFEPQDCENCPDIWKTIYSEKNARLQSVYTGQQSTNLFLSNLWLNELLETKRLQNIPIKLEENVEILGKQLMTSFYTFQEFCPFVGYCEMVCFLVFLFLKKAGKNRNSC